MEKYFLKFFLFSFLIAASSCSNSRVYLDVIEGNYAFSRGEYQEANFDYARVKGIEPYTEYISYNLGNVFYALGEIDSAVKEWESINENGKMEITVRKLFNTGVLLFELSRYEESYKIFRHVLEIDPSNINAKINLEYSIQKMNFTTENRAPLSETPVKDLQKTDDVSRILDFVKRKETNIWESENNSNSDLSKLKDW
jgi:tetratricopeptide (TPR) repeat protein